MDQTPPFGQLRAQLFTNGSGEQKAGALNALLAAASPEVRAVADFEYEYQMAGMNQQLNQRVETVFLMADVALQPIASRLVKEIALYGGDIRPFVPAGVAREVAARVAAIGPKRAQGPIATSSTGPDPGS